MSDLTTYSLKQNKQESLLSECTISYHVSAFSHLGHHLISTKVLTHSRILQDDELLHLLNVKGPRSSCWTAFPEHTKVTRFHHVIFHQQQAILYLTFFLVPQKHWKSVKIWTENSSWSHLMGVSGYTWSVALVAELMWFFSVCSERMAVKIYDPYIFYFTGCIEM